ncbi:hypothetical protein ACFWM1_09650 [Nocardia sp. NPDC058379]|uniref:hypothetical protein n=1 Tax=unclassified Nocardia TaxID=2637762 RepID=UPI00364A5A72
MWFPTTVVEVDRSWPRWTKARRSLRVCTRLVAALLLAGVRAWAVVVETDYTSGRFTLYEIVVGGIVAFSLIAATLALMGMTARVPALRGLTVAAAGVALGESSSSLAAWAEVRYLFDGLAWLYLPMTLCALVPTATAALAIAVAARKG